MRFQLHKSESPANKSQVTVQFLVSLGRFRYRRRLVRDVRLPHLYLAHTDILQSPSSHIVHRQLLGWIAAAAPDE